MNARPGLGWGMKRAFVPSRLLLAALLLLPAAHAQVLYKSTLANGRVVYGDKPDPSAVKVEPITPETSKGGIGGTTTPGEAQTLRQMQSSREARERADARIQKAQKALQDAETARAAGVEPLEGERIGTAGGASRLTESYDARRRQLDAAVNQARRELERARAAVR
jgi:hypothetical protein